MRSYSFPLFMTAHLTLIVLGVTFRNITINKL